MKLLVSKNYGGLHLKFKVNPDMAIFGKALGNGYPISAVIGKRKYNGFRSKNIHKLDDVD